MQNDSAKTIAEEAVEYDHEYRDAEYEYEANMDPDERGNARELLGRACSVGPIVGNAERLVLDRLARVRAEEPPKTLK